MSAARKTPPATLNTESASSGPRSADELLAELRAVGARRYHDRHPFHLAMHAGELTREQLQAWVANRYYYQTRIPIKDALIVARSEDVAFRRAWLRRIVDHDGEREGEGGLALWLRLADGVGLPRGEVEAFVRVLPGVRFACDAYVTLVRERSLVEAVASSLTESFSPDLMERRIEAWEKHYPWVDRDLLAYFRSRVPRARRDAVEAVGFVLDRARTRAEQDACIEALAAKCDILWSLLDAVAAAHGIGQAPGLPWGGPREETGAC